MKSASCLHIGLAVVLASVGCFGPAAAEVTLLSRAARISDTAAGESALPFGSALRSAVSGDGRFVVFASRATNLVSGQIKASPGQDAFLFDRLAGTTRVVSRRRGTVATTAGLDSSTTLAISRDGSCVVFASPSTELVPGQVDANSGDDVFVYDVATGQVTLVSHAAGGPATAGNTASSPGGELAVSHDCRYIAYASLATNLVAGQVDASTGTDVFLFDRQTGTNILVSHQAEAPATTANEQSSRLTALSGSGGRVAFTSLATDLVAGQIDTNSGYDVFLFDVATGGITLVSHASGSATTAGDGGAAGLSLSADGNSVAYLSLAGNLVAGHSDPSGIAWDVFLFDRTTGTNVLASRSAASATASGNATAKPSQAPSVSDDGRYTVFVSSATNLVAGQVDALVHFDTDDDVFLFDRVTGTTTLVSHTGALSPSTTAGNRASGGAQVSADGGSVSFVSRSPLGYVDAEDDTDVFLFRRDTGRVDLVSRAFDTPNGAALGPSSQPAVSADGRFVAYSSPAADIALFDTNGISDVFLFDRNSFGSNVFVSRRAADMPSTSGNTDSLIALPHNAPQLSADGRYAAFLTRAGNLFPGFDAAGILSLQVVVADRLTGAVHLGSRSTAPSCPGCPSRNDSFEPALSADGSRVAFTSIGGDMGPAPGSLNASQVFSQHLPSRSMLLVSHAAASPDERPNGNSYAPASSADGRTVVFKSVATDLVPGTDPNSSFDIFVAGPGPSIALVSHAAGTPNVAADDTSDGARISAEGRYVAFQSGATDLVSGITDDNGRYDVFLHDRATGDATLVSHTAASAAVPADGDSEVLDLSADGRFVLFSSTATNLVGGQVDAAGSLDLFLSDRVTGESQLVTRAGGTVATAAGLASYQGRGTLSADGRYSAFWSLSSSIVPGQVDTSNTFDLFLFDRLTGEMALVSHTSGSQVTAAHGDPAVTPAISADGRFVAWVGQGTNIVTGQIDANGGEDVFVYDRQTGGNRLVSRALGTVATAGAGRSSWPEISADGRSILFTSSADDLVANDRNQLNDVFLDRAPTVPGAFFTVAPCRVADSRDSATPLAHNTPRSLALHAACGIPSTAKAVSLNLTVVAGDAAGFATLFPGDQPVPATSTVNFRAGQAKANNAVAQLALDGSGTLGIVTAFGGAGPVHVIVDVNGYFE